MSIASDCAFLEIVNKVAGSPLTWTSIEGSSFPSLTCAISLIKTQKKKKLERTTISAISCADLICPVTRTNF